MPLDPSARRFLGALAATNPPSTLDLTVEARRRGLADLMGFGGAPEAVGRVENRLVPGPEDSRPVRVYTPLGAAAESLPALIYFHGGGLVAGSLDTHDGICRLLTNSSGCRLISVDYRLAPEHRCPAAISDCIAVTRWIVANPAAFGIDPELVIVSGDSAGATLAAVVCQTAARDRQPQLKGQILLCPILDLAAESDSRREFAEGHLVDRATLEHDLLHYLPEGMGASDPRVSPLRAENLSDLPPTSIHTAECDPLRDEGKAYAERLQRAGIAANYVCHPGMIHLFYGMGAVIPYAGTAITRIGSEIRALLS